MPLLQGVGDIDMPQSDHGIIPPALCRVAMNVTILLAYVSSQHLQCRSVNPAQDFNALITQEIMADLLSKSDHFGHRYNGKNHSQFASSIKEYTSAAKRPLNRAEQSQLIRMLQNFTPTRSWNWRSLTTTLHSFTSAGVFTSHKPMDERVKLTQAHLLSTLLDAIIFNCSQKTSSQKY